VADSFIQVNPEESAVRQNEERERQLVRNAPVAMIVSDRKTQQIELANDRFVRLFGYKVEDIPGVDDWWPVAYPDESYREKVKAEWAALTERVVDDPERIECMDARVRCKDGVFRDIEFHLSVIGDSFLVSFVDLTDRKRAEQALRESEERLRLAAQAGKMYAFEWDAITDKVVLSAESADILGFSSEPGQRTGQGWFAQIFPQDRANFVKMIAELNPNKPTYQTSYRIISPSGEFIWLEESGAASFDAQGRTVRVVGMVANVTPRKEAERALATVSGKLIEAQEQERRRIARDLHDDINQRLALLNIELQRLADSPPDAQTELRRKMEELCRQASEISSDVSALTRELHSPKLELLGIVPAMRGLCDELAERQRVKIDFRHDNVPSRLPRDVSLCLFRVLQEALRNAVKHSGVQRFAVQLLGHPGEIQLTIRDEGVGFDPDEVARGDGLGLVSMRERVGLLRGTIGIMSDPKTGTEIKVRVPLTSTDT
jgi:PAS domain S-box-containing protein